MHFAPKAFAVHVDPTSLPAGLQFAAIKAFESSKPEKGWVLDVPVTVLKPEVRSDTFFHIEGIPGYINKLILVYSQCLVKTDGATFVVIE